MTNTKPVPTLPYGIDARRCNICHATGQFPGGEARRFPTVFANGFRARRLTPLSDSLAVIMAARETASGYEYVVATVEMGATEWNAGRYVRSMVEADRAFYARVRRLS